MPEIIPPQINSGVIPAPKHSRLKAIVCFFVGHNVDIPGEPGRLYYYCHRCWKKGVGVDVLMERTPKCRYDFKPGWWCSREWKHEGPCALRPKWYNLIDRYDYWSRGGR